MIHDRGQSGPENDLQRRELQARYLQDSVGSARASRRLRRAIAGSVLQRSRSWLLRALARPRYRTPARSPIAPSEITAGMRDLPESERWDTH